MPSFDIVSEVNQVELRNALDQTNKEVSNRFDFKGSDARVEQADKVLTVFADDDFKLGQVYDVLIGKLAKRGVDIRCLQRGKVETISGDKVKQVITVKVRVDQELGKKLQKLIKDAKLKVQPIIHGYAAYCGRVLLHSAPHLLGRLQRGAGPVPGDFIRPRFAPGIDELLGHLHVALHAEILAYDEALILAIPITHDADATGRNRERFTVPVKGFETRQIGSEPQPRQAVVPHFAFAPAHFLDRIAPAAAAQCL